MADEGPCDLHEAATALRPGERDAFLRWARLPIAEECRRCAVCRSARLYIERRLAEGAGKVPPAGESAEGAWQDLQSAVAEARTAIQRGL